MNKIAWTTKNNDIWAIGEPVKQAFYDQRIRQAKQMGVWQQYKQLPLHKVRKITPEDFIKMIK